MEIHIQSFDDRTAAIADKMLISLSKNSDLIINHSRTKNLGAIETLVLTIVGTAIGNVLSNLIEKIISTSKKENISIEIILENEGKSYEVPGDEEILLDLKEKTK